MRIATFNVQNLRLRHPLGRARLDGARDGDASQDTDPQDEILDMADRRLTAEVLVHADADVICLQEVFDLESLKFFHDHFLSRAGGTIYPHRFCFPGNDGAGRNVALMSRRPVAELVSHVDVTAAELGLNPLSDLKPNAPIFRRDCLLARINELTLYLCHFKAPWPDAQASWSVRRLEALAVKRLIEHRFGTSHKLLWLILGDLNEPSSVPEGERAIEPLIYNFSVDLMQRVPVAERWSHYEPSSKSYSRPDFLLASPALAEKWPHARPYALREGLSFEIDRYKGPRLAGVGPHRPHASDHAPLVVEFTAL